MTTSEVTLIGRERERAVLRRAVLHPGPGTVLVGEAGTGRTALLDEAAEVAEAAGHTVLRAAGAEEEAALPLAGLHQLLMPVLARPAALPDHLAHALRRAFGLGHEVPAGDDPDTASAVAALLSDPIRRMVVVVDDVDQLDAASLTVLRAVAARRGEGPPGLLLSARPARVPPVRGVRELRLDPLGTTDGARLLDRVAPDAPPELSTAVLAVARGNPLALTELPACLDGPGGDALRRRLALGLTSAIPLSPRLARAFVPVVSGLPLDARTLLVVAAGAAGDPFRDVLRATTALLGVATTSEVAQPLYDAAVLVADDEEVRFRHPLLRAGVLHVASGAERRSVHHALADATDDDVRRAWHSSCALPPDGELLAHLDVVGERAVERGEIEMALALVEQALEQSSTQHDRVRRAMRAAELALDLGRRATAARLLTRTSEADDPSVPALHVLASGNAGPPAEDEQSAVTPTLAAAHRAASGGRPDLAQRVLDGVADSPSPPDREAAVAVARGVLARYPAEPFGLVVVARSTRDAGTVRTRVVAALDRDGLPPGAEGVHVIAAVHAYDIDVGAQRLGTVAEVALAQGRQPAAGRALCYLGLCRLLRGDVGGAERAARRAHALERGEAALDAALLLAWTQHVRARTGRAPADDGLVRAVTGRGTAFHRTLLALTLGAAALSRARYDRCADLLGGLLAEEVWGAWFALPDYVEACARSARSVEVGPVLERLDVVVGANPCRFLAEQRLVARALLATTTPDPAPQAGLDDPVVVNPLLKARVALAEGMGLRRRRRVRAARGRLLEARDLLSEAGPTAWDDAVARELSATGTRDGGAGPDALGLTPQEKQVARLAAQGFSNADVAAHLLISTRTVGTHLQRVFHKLDVHRREDIDPAALGL